MFPQTPILEPRFSGYPRFSGFARKSWFWPYFIKIRGLHHFDLHHDDCNANHCFKGHCIFNATEKKIFFLFALQCAMQKKKFFFYFYFLKNVLGWKIFWDAKIFFAKHKSQVSAKIAMRGKNQKKARFFMTPPIPLKIKKGKRFSRAKTVRNFFAIGLKALPDSKKVSNFIYQKRRGV